MGEPVTVAVVEDDPDLRELHRLRLEAEYDVVTIANGTEALSRIAAEDVLLLDRNLPETDGDSIARELRARGYRGAVAMVTSERPDPAVATLPIDEYVTKPLDSEELLSLVDRLTTRLDAPEPIRDLFAMETRRHRLENTPNSGDLVESDPYRSLSRRIDRQYYRVTVDGFPLERIAAFAGNALEQTIVLPDEIGSSRGDPGTVEATPGPGQEL
ncbi:response regulator transcription factor [Halorhabdus rudnickae]|uniref:response regulator transcription factor n=1 Tax=Halorhabdus rudnickae TaxID=1775544 RepID=UPI00108324C6|nr:response regulator [Halorhabdus rudnickae]